MATLEVRDRSSCCSSSCCSSSCCGGDPAAARFAADLAWLESQGVAVRRCDSADGPVVCVDGRVVSRAGYPTRAQLAAWCGVEEKPAAACCAARCCG